MSITAQDRTRILRIGLVGLGGATKQMLPSLACHPRIHITAGADPRPEARERFTVDFGAPAYETAEQLYANRDVDVVYIGTPHQWHKQNAVAAAEHRKHIIVEKPMALTLADCDSMIEAARRNSVHLIVGHTHSFDAPIVKVREIIRSGELGPVAMINTWNYNDYLYRLRWPAELRTELGGGIIYNQVPHQVDVVRLLGGGLVRSVRSMAWVLDAARGTEGSHITFLQFEDGSAASMVFSGYDYFDSDEFHFWVGELGEEKAAGRHGNARALLSNTGGPAAEVAAKSSSAYGAAAPGNQPTMADGGRSHHPHFGLIVVSCTGGDMRPSADGVLIYGRKGCVEVPVPRPRAFPDKSGVIDEMYDALVTGHPPLHDGQWGKATLEVCQAILTSAHERSEVLLSHQVPVEPHR